MRPANSNPLLWVRPRNSRGRVDDHPGLWVDRSLVNPPYENHQSFHTHRNMPLVHLHIRIEQTVVEIVHQTKLKRC